MWPLSPLRLAIIYPFCQPKKRYKTLQNATKDYKTLQDATKRYKTQHFLTRCHCEWSQKKRPEAAFE
jgi:hypothetical protein